MRNILLGAALCLLAQAQELSTLTIQREENEATRGLRGVTSLDLAAAAGAHRGLAEAAPSKEELKALRAQAAAKREAAKKDRERAKAAKAEHKHTKVFLPGTKTDHKHHKHHTKDDLPAEDESSASGPALGQAAAAPSAQLEAEVATATYREAKALVKGHAGHQKSKSLLEKVASALPGHSKKDDKKAAGKAEAKAEAKAAAKAALAGDDGSLVSFVAPAVGDRVTLMMRAKALTNVDGVVTVADPAAHMYNIKLDDGRTVKKAKLGGIHAPPPVGTEVTTRGFKAELNGLRGRVSAVDAAAWQVLVALDDGRSLRRVKWSNLLFLPPNGVRVRTRGMQKDMTGKSGVVVASDFGKWQVQVALNGEPKAKWLHPGKLELDFGEPKEWL